MPLRERRDTRVSLFSFGLLNFNLKLISAHAWKIGAVAVAQVFSKLGQNSDGFLPLAVLRPLLAVLTTFVSQSCVEHGRECEWL